MPQFQFGWHEDRKETDRIVAMLPNPLFVSAAPDLMQDDPKDTWLWDVESSLFGETLPAHDQEIGDCVSHGWGRGVQDLLLTDAATAGNGFPGLIATEAIYALSRVEIGGGRLRGDGSVGAWAADAARKFGFLLRKKYGRVDLTHYRGELAKDWGTTGLPDDLEPVAKEHPVRDVTLVTDIDQARVAIQNRFPIPVCSGQGFETVRQKGTGVCAPEGTWAHCMLVRAFLILKGGRWVFTIQQSWGESPTGPNRVDLESGQVLTLPQGCFNVDADVLEAMFRKWQDSFAIAGLRGWERPAPLVFLQTDRQPLT
ncbi:MAG: hypothetical protein R3E01_36685 [Pirellulaceae bacterium]